MENNKLYSYHVFLFPFQWEFVGKMMKDKNMEERTSLKELVGLFNKNHWKRKEYKIDTVLNYNEYNYYYGMVRDVLFDDGKNPDKSIIRNLFYDIEPDQHFYEFKVCTNADKGEFKTYKLHIESIILHLYSTGVGVLSFHLNNRLESQKEPDDILNINQAGRRIYPPFFAMDFSLIGTQGQYGYNDFAEGLKTLKKHELADDFAVIDNLKIDDFSSYHNSKSFTSNPFQLPRYFTFLFGDVPLTVDKSDYNSETKKVLINPLLDDRMYVICWYGNQKLCNELSSESLVRRNNIPVLKYETNEWWYKYVFNDQKWPTCQDKEMKIELIKKHTYTRWSGYNTFYGINRYSFVCLTNTLENLKNPPISSAFLVNHMQTIYYKMAELCLVQRACILRFSDEVAGISAMNEKNLTDRVSTLYKQYIRFVNRIYFREVTAQEQGIEMYNMIQEHMKIEQNVKDLDTEISELHHYAVLLEDKKRNKSLSILSIIGAIFIIPTFITGFFGMNLLPNLNDSSTIYKMVWVLFFIGIFCSPVMVVWYIRASREKNRYWMLVVAAILLLLSIMSPIILKIVL